MNMHLYIVIVNINISIIMKLERLNIRHKNSTNIYVFKGSVQQYIVKSKNNFLT